MQIKSQKLSKVKNISHGFFSKKGGCSKGIYKSLNCGLGSKDKKIHVIKNIEVIKKKFSCNNINLLNQIHSNKIIHLKRKNKNIRLGYADGIFTSLNKIIIGVLTADCIPILFSSKCGKFICAVHGGWKGLHKNIIKNTLKLFIKNKIKKSDIICAIGPCIGFKSYEVKSDFKSKIINKNSKYQKLFKIKKGKIFFNIKQYALTKLIEQKISRKNIQIIDKDTYSSPKFFFSFRRSVHKKEDDYGRNISVIVKDS